MRRCPTCDGFWPTEAEQAIQRDTNEARRRADDVLSRAIVAAQGRHADAVDAINRDHAAAMKAAETGAELPGQVDLFSMDGADA